MHKTLAGEVGDVVREREMRIESNTKITDRGISRTRYTGHRNTIKN